MTDTPTADETRYWLALNRIPGVGTVTFHRLLDTFGDPQAALQAGITAWSQLGLGKPDWDAVAQDLQWLAGADNHIITLQDPRYPTLLKQIPDPPPLLYLHGDPDCLRQPQLAVVGSRNPSRSGRQTAREFATHLARAGLTITSGLAQGLDGAAHEGALQGGGQSIAVTGTGLDRVYPASHHDLAHAIACHGALVTEFPPGTPPRAENFPRRNRIISGLSLGTLVVEAAVRSGSLITARLALEQGREVLAIPGSIHNPLARGCHTLIRQGAKLVETAEDILEELGALGGFVCQESHPEIPADSREGAAPLPPEYQQLLDYMGYDPTSIDTLVDHSGLTAGEVSSMLLLLELQDFVASSAGGRYVRTEKRV